MAGPARVTAKLPARPESQALGGEPKNGLGLIRLPGNLPPDPPQHTPLLLLLGASPPTVLQVRVCNAFNFSRYPLLVLAPSFLAVQHVAGSLSLSTSLP